LTAYIYLFEVLCIWVDGIALELSYIY